VTIAGDPGDVFLIACQTLCLSPPRTASLTQRTDGERQIAFFLKGKNLWEMGCLGYFPGHFASTAPSAEDTQPQKWRPPSHKHESRLCLCLSKNQGTGTTGRDPVVG
jgi:hypothetical protein